MSELAPLAPGEQFPLAPRVQHPLSLPAADAERLGEDYERAQEHFEHADALATRVGYAHDWKKFREYCQEHGVAFLPAHPETVAAYCSYLGERARNPLRGRTGYRPATLDRAKAAIATEHKKAGLSSPCSDVRVRRVMRSLKKQLVARQRRARPLLPAHLAAIFAWLDKRWAKRPVRAARDKAILLAGFAGALRRSELVALRREDVRVMDENVVFFVARSKTDQEGKGEHVDFSRDERMPVCPVRGLRAWDAQLEGAGFFIRRVSNEQIINEPVSSKKVTRLVCDGAAAIGLDPDDYSAHSLRAGFATWAIYVVEMNPWDVKKHLRHKKVAMLDVYVRAWDEVPSVG